MCMCLCVCERERERERVRGRWNPRLQFGYVKLEMSVKRRRGAVNQIVDYTNLLFKEESGDRDRNLAVVSIEIVFKVM